MHFSSWETGSFQIENLSFQMTLYSSWRIAGSCPNAVEIGVSCLLNLKSQVSLSYFLHYYCSCSLVGLSAYSNLEQKVTPSGPSRFLHSLRGWNFDTLTVVGPQLTGVSDN